MHGSTAGTSITEPRGSARMVMSPAVLRTNSCGTGNDDMTMKGVCWCTEHVRLITPVNVSLLVPMCYCTKPAALSDYWLHLCCRRRVCPGHHRLAHPGWVADFRTIVQFSINIRLSVGSLHCHRLAAKYTEFWDLLKPNIGSPVLPNLAENGNLLLW